MIKPIGLAFTFGLAVLIGSSQLIAGELKGPGRFCGYSPIIDLAADEVVTTLDGGIHSGSFKWRGAFGEFFVRGIGWASKPKGKMLRQPTSKGHAIFAQRREKGKFVVAIWNREHGAAYFQTQRRMTPAHLRAIDRVDLFDENYVYDKSKEPQGCELRTIFVWE